LERNLKILKVSFDPLGPITIVPPCTPTLTSLSRLAAVHAANRDVSSGRIRAMLSIREIKVVGFIPKSSAAPSMPLIFQPVYDSEGASPS
jgi:hypothetical protein